MNFLSHLSGRPAVKGYTGTIPVKPAVSDTSLITSNSGFENSILPSQKEGSPKRAADVPSLRILPRPFLLNHITERVPVPSSASHEQIWMPVLKLLLQFTVLIFTMTTELRSGRNSVILQISLLSAYRLGKNHKTSFAVRMPSFSKRPALRGPPQERVPAAPSGRCGDSEPTKPPAPGEIMPP